MRPDALLATGRRLWIGSLLWIIGRTLCRAARVDEAVRRELAPPAGRPHHQARGKRHDPGAESLQVRGALALR